MDCYYLHAAWIKITQDHILTLDIVQVEGICAQNFQQSLYPICGWFGFTLSLCVLCLSDPQQHQSLLSSVDEQNCAIFIAKPHISNSVME